MKYKYLISYLINLINQHRIVYTLMIEEKI